MILCGWEGNRRSGVALVMRHRLQWFIHLRAHGLRHWNEHPAYLRSAPLPCIMTYIKTIELQCIYARSYQCLYARASHSQDLTESCAIVHTQDHC